VLTSVSKLGPVSDPWDEEGFGGEDDWEGSQSLESDLEDDSLAGLDDELDEAELDQVDLNDEDDEER
jgi:hypothetical protein